MCIFMDILCEYGLREGDPGVSKSCCEEEKVDRGGGMDCGFNLTLSTAQRAHFFYVARICAAASSYNVQILE